MALVERLFLQGIGYQRNHRSRTQTDLFDFACGFGFFAILEHAPSYNEAISILDKHFKKPTRIIYARHQLLSCRQKSDESILDFINRLKILLQKCECKAVNIQEHQQLLIRDALVAGVKSDIIRMRLLEQTDEDTTLENCISLASAIELSSDYNRSFRGTEGLDSSVPSSEAASELCATGRPPTSTVNEGGQVRNKWQFCGLRGHPRRNCPAQNDSCHKCQKKGHWATACRSQLAVTQQAQPEESSVSALSSVLLAAGGSSDAFYALVKVGKKEFLGLVDSGASESFISYEAARQCNGKITMTASATQLADKTKLPILGHIDLTMQVNAETYSTRLKIAKSLLADIIIGMDLLGQHAVVQLETKGDRGPVSFSKAAQGTHAAVMFPALDIEPPILFSTITKQRAKPITTKSRYASRENQEYLTQEIDRLLEAGIIEPSSSPWRAQAFVVRRGSKPRMVIDYSETINRYTEPDGYPFPEVETILDGAAQDKYFSRVDLKSAYHQVPIQESDRPFTAFEANGALYQFTRLAFGLTNAVPVFQRVIDSIIRKEKLEKTRAYLDDVIISGATQEEHDRNLERFISTVKKYGITLNKDKCLINVQRISVLGHILEKGTKRPDPERLKTLMDYPLPATKQELHRFIGFFAYNAKWIAHYSDKVRPLLDAFNAGLLALPESAVKAIGKLKDAIAKSVLVVPKPGSPLIMTTDASGTAIGGTLTQDSQPIAFFSRSLSSGERKQSAAERQALAIVECSRKWMPYMRAYHTLIQTDQEAVAFIFSCNKSKVKNDKLMRWRLELSTLSYGIEYKKGSENIAADAL